MTVWESIEALSKEMDACVLTLGNFDGGHLGHQSLFLHLIREGKRLNLPTVALTFDPHPQEVIQGKSPALLMTKQQRIDWMDKMGADHAIIQPFDRSFSFRTPRSFMKELLVEKLGVRSLIVGPTTHIGKGRAGTPDRIETLAKEMGMEAHVLHPITIDGKVVQSSLIRTFIQEGKIQHAASFLGRNFRTQGRVVGGEEIGRTLGFPTANLADVQTLIPKNGVYATRTHWKSQTYVSATNIGLRPTVSKKRTRTVETFLLDFEGDLMGETLELEWVERIRDERKFPSREALLNQIQEDIEQVRAIHELERKT